ncbi:MAG: hypothetical protein AAB461_01750 [Patescibacteria group bacterium]
MAKTKELESLSEELKKKLQHIANTKSTTIVSFVAPHGVRTSPVGFASASIEEDEIYRIEKVVEKAVSKKATGSLHLIIHTPGGEMHACYKIANFLRSKFTKVGAFVPYQAASGGTILCCSANELYIGDLGNITCFDPQIQYKGVSVSTHAFVRAVESIQREYGEIRPIEIPPPWQQMAEKIDPIIYDEMHTALVTSIICAVRLLKKSGYSESSAFGIARGLGWNAYTHELPIFKDAAKELGFNIKEDEETLKVYKELVSARLDEQYPRHIIDDFYPEHDLTPTDQQ